MSGARRDPRGADHRGSDDARSVSDAAAILVVLRTGDRDALIVGLGADERRPMGASAGTAGARPKRLTHNAMLKMVFKGAATSILMQHRTSVLFADERMVAAGTKPNLAKVTLARKIAATALAMWKKKEAYDPNKRTSKIT